MSKCLNFLDELNSGLTPNNQPTHQRTLWTNNSFKTCSRASIFLYWKWSYWTNFEIVLYCVVYLPNIMKCLRVLEAKRKRVNLRAGLIMILPWSKFSRSRRAESTTGVLQIAILTWWWKQWTPGKNLACFLVRNNFNFYGLYREIGGWMRRGLNNQK